MISSSIGSKSSSSEKVIFPYPSSSHENIPTKGRDIFVYRLLGFELLSLRRYAPVLSIFVIIRGMTKARRVPLHRESDKELVGYLVQDATGWQAQTVFGYTIERTEDRATAELILREHGMSVLTGVWQYFDRDEQSWHACVLKEVQEHQVTIMRTNAMGYQDPNDYKKVTLQRPTDSDLIKA